MAGPQGVGSGVGAHFAPDYQVNNTVMFEKELSLVFSIGNPSQDCERLFSAIEGGAFSLSDILSHTMPLDDVAKAYRDFDEKRAQKVVLIP